MAVELRSNLGDSDPKETAVGWNESVEFRQLNPTYRKSAIALSHLTFPITRRRQPQTLNQ